MIAKVVPKAACDHENCQKATCDPESFFRKLLVEPESCSKCRLWSWKLIRMPTVILKIVRMPLVFLKLFRKPPVNLKVVPNAAYDLENCFECHLWSWKLFRKPPVNLKVVPNFRLWSWKLSESHLCVPKVVPKSAYDIILADYFCIQRWLDTGEESSDDREEQLEQKFWCGFQCGLYN